MVSYVMRNMENLSIHLHCHGIKSVRILIFSGPHFPTFELNTEIYSVNLRIQSECGTMWTRETPLELSRIWITWAVISKKVKGKKRNQCWRVQTEAYSGSNRTSYTVWNVSKYGVFSVPYFDTFHTVLDVWLVSECTSEKLVQTVQIAQIKQ